MKILSNTAVTYDDVLLVPQFSDVTSRRRLSTASRLTQQLQLQVPIVSANMDTVTESDMAIAIAREAESESSIDSCPSKNKPPDNASQESRVVHRP